MNRYAFKYALRRSLLLAGCVSLAFVSMPARAQDLSARVNRLENEIQTLSRAMFRGEEPPPGFFAGAEGSANSANIEVRLQQIEMELSTLTGRLEQQNFDTVQYREGLDRRLGDIEMRLNALEGGTAAGRMGGVSGNAGLGTPSNTPPLYSYESGYDSLPTAPPPSAPPMTGSVSAGLGGQGDYATEQPAPADDTPVAAGQLGTLRQPAEAPPIPGQTPDNSTYVDSNVPVNDPAGLYERAFSFIRDRNYPEAQAAFEDFLARYPQHDLAGNAKYWLGETFYVRGDFERAVRVFAEAYQQYPKGPKAPDNLLKLGMALSGMGKKDEACLTFSQLDKEYPDGAAPILTRAEQEMEKLGCPSL